MTIERIPKEVPFPSKYVDVNGSKMHYIETGSGNPILFLHGIPTSSYLWRNIMPHLATLGRCIAPDLIGYGKSDKPNIEYSIFNHIEYINKFIEALKLKNITIIMHGWGSIIGFDYAMRHEANCNGLVFYEAILHSLAGNDMSLPYQEQLMSLRSVEQSELINNSMPLVEQMLAQAAMRELTDDEMKFYSQPFSEQGSGKPIVDYLLELPKGDGQSKIDQLISRYSEKLTKSFLPKLLLYSVPGFITTIESVIWARDNLLNLEIAEIGEELHLAQESFPDLMGEIISVWLQGVEQAHA